MIDQQIPTWLHYSIGKGGVVPIIGGVWIRILWGQQHINVLMETFELCLRIVVIM